MGPNHVKIVSNFLLELQRNLPVDTVVVVTEVNENDVSVHVEYDPLFHDHFTVYRRVPIIKLISFTHGPEYLAREEVREINAAYDRARAKWNSNS